MKTIRAIQIVSVSLLLWSSLAVAGIGWVSYGSAEGVPAGVVTAVAVSNNGTLWTGSLAGGVAKYDGSTFTGYKTTEGLPSNLVTDIFIGNDGLLWVSTGSGISTYNGSSWTNSAAQIFCYTVAADANGQKWLGYSNGAGIYSGNDWYVASNIMGVPINTIAPTPQGYIWFGSDQGLTYYSSNSQEYFTADGGILHLLTTTGFNTYVTKKGPISNEISKVFVDAQNNVWVGTDKGLSKYNGSTWTHFDRSSGLAADHVGAIAQDKEGNIWIGYSAILNPIATGASRYNGSSWQHFTTANGLGGDRVYDIAIAPNGDIWFATNAGLSMYGSLPPAPAISISTTSLDFGTTIGGARRDTSFAISNTGDKTLVIDSTRSTSSAFTVTTSLSSLAPGGSQQLGVRYAPATYGSHSGTLRIYSNDKNNPLKQITLTGINNTPPQIAVSADTIRFGKVRLGSSSSYQLKVTNTGQTTLNISSIFVMTSSVFACSSRTFSLAYNKSENLPVTFTPNRASTFSGEVVISSNDPVRASKRIFLFGEGVRSDLYLAEKYCRVNCAETYLDSTRATTLELENRGGEVLIVNSVFLKQARGFSIEGRPDSISAGRKATLLVLFHPTTAGEYFDTLVVATMDTLVMIPCYGKGIELPFFNSTSGDITYRAESPNLVVWLKANYDILSSVVKVYYSLDGGDTFQDPVVCAQAAGGRVEAQIPSQPEGKVVKYYLEVNHPTLGLKYMPPNAPSQTYNLRVLYSANVNGDLRTDIFDLLDILRRIPAGDVAADINRDGKVDVFDLLDMLRALSAN